MGRQSYKRNESSFITQAGSVLETEGDLTLASAGGQAYQAARLQSGANLTLDSGGDIAFEGVKDFIQESRIKSKSNWAKTSDKGQGRTNETVRQSELVAAGERVIHAAGKIHLDIPEINASTVSQTIDALVQADPALAWLKDMDRRGEIDWRHVKEVHDQWSYSHSRLGQGLTLAIAIVTAVVAGPAASSWIGSTAGAAAGSGTAMAAAGTSAMVSAGTAVGTAAAGWANAALSAAAASAASTATVSFINNKGDIGQTLEDTFSGEAIKGYASAGVIAGLGSYTDMWGRTMTENGNTLLTDLPERAKAYALNTAAKGVLTDADSSKGWATVAGIGLAGEAYQYWVGREADIRPGVDRPEGPKFDPIPEDGFFRVPTTVVDGIVREGKNIGFNDACLSSFSICHGTPISNALNAVPGFNGFGTLHDTWMNWMEQKNLMNTVINIGSMPPAMTLNYGSIVNRYYWLKPTLQQVKDREEKR